MTSPARADDAMPAPEAAPASAFAPATPGPEPEIDTSIERYRTPLEALNERLIGAASKSIRFDWRNATVGVAVMGSELLERNNFGSARLGLLVRKPLGDVMGEVGITRVWTWSTTSSERLKLTPYRQPARPNRFELDVNAGYPLAEGVVTAWPSFFPPAEMVFSVNAGFRYLFYPGTLGGKDFLGVAEALMSPKLTESELEALEEQRLGGMELDPARYGLMAGFSLDVYLQPGAFLSPRLMVALPILSPANGTGLGFWWEMTLGLGWTF